MSTSSDEAANKRQRVSRACDLCRKKKIKCNGESPICGNCKAFHLVCSYKDTTKKRGPPKGYIEAIENRLHKLEGFLHDIANENDPRTIELLRELQAPLETTTGEQINARPQRRQKRRQTKKDPIDSPISALYSPTLSHSELDNTSTIGSPSPHQEGLVGSLTMDENGLVRYLGKSSGFYLLSNSRTYQNGTFHFSGYRHKRKSHDDNETEQENRLEKRHIVDPLELPPKDLSEHLIVLYFTHFYPILPLFYKRKLGCVKSPSSPVSPLLLNAIYALASRVSPDKRVRSDPHAPDTAGDIFFERARCLLDAYYDTPRISTIQALLLMASHQMGAMKPARGWLYSGMAFRMAQDLGLNRNCDHWSILPEERERRKRVFWCCYVVDRITSAIYGRSSNFEERDCDVPFPSVDDDEPIRSKEDSSRPSAGLLQVFIETIKVCDILGHVLKNIYYVKAKYHTTDPQHIDHILTTLHRQLTEWHSHLPEALQYQPPNTQNGEKGPDPPAPICQLHLMYYTTMILLHRSFIPGPTQKQLPISLSSYKICESAATSILDIVNIMLGENHLRYMYNFSVFYVFTAGIIFIKLASSDDVGRSFDARLNVNRVMRALDELENTWMNAARCSNILGELAGLRDIKLERDKYVPRQINKSSPPPSIAVPNSPILNTTVLPKETDDKDMTYSAYQWPQQQISQYMYNISSVRQDNTSKDGYFDIKATLDPFEAPGIIPHSQPQEFDLLETAFWGMPTSLDTHEWNAYFGNLTNQRQEKQQVESYLLSSDTSSTLQQQAASFMFTSTPQEHQRQSSTNSATSADVPNSPSQSILFGFMNNRQQQQQQQEPILVSSPTSMTHHAFSPSLNTPHKPTNVLYW